MDWNNLIIAVISALSGGALASFLTYRIGNRKQDESEFTTLVNEYKEMVASYKEEVHQLRVELDSIRKAMVEREVEVKHLRQKLKLFEKTNIK